jgi:hypothetical protein
MPDGTTYQRGQAEWALWQMFTHDRGTPVPKVFNSRIRKLWELGIPVPVEERQGPGPAFEYSLYHCFELMVALRLQEAGLVHSEIGALIYWERASLRKHFDMIDIEQISPVFFTFCFQSSNFGDMFELEGHDYHVDIDSLMKDLSKLKGRALVIIELAGIVEYLKIWIPKAPEFKKGRPKGAS